MDTVTYNVICAMAPHAIRSELVPTRDQFVGVGGAVKCKGVVTIAFACDFEGTEVREDNFYLLEGIDECIICGVAFIHKVYGAKFLMQVTAATKFPTLELFDDDSKLEFFCSGAGLPTQLRKRRVSKFFNGQVQMQVYGKTKLLKADLLPEGQRGYLKDGGILLLPM